MRNSLFEADGQTGRTTAMNAKLDVPFGQRARHRIPPTVGTLELSPMAWNQS